MNNIKKVISALVLVIIVLSGCSINVPEEIVPEQFHNTNAGANTSGAQANDSRNRFTTSVEEDISFEEARNWAEKYKELKEQNEHLKKLNSELAVDNKRVMQRFDAMKTNLEIAEDELSAANEMLIEQRKELNDWKTNVLGYQEKNDYVHKEQLKAMVKILKLLGAEHVVPEEG